jgi:hypothetical protein
MALITFFLKATALRKRVLEVEIAPAPSAMLLVLPPSPDEEFPFCFLTTVSSNALFDV